MAKASFSPNRTYTFSTRARIDEATLNVNRFEAEARAGFDRWSVGLMYGNYAAQPELGYLTRREGVLGSASVKVAANWVVSGSARWDLEANKINQYVVGAGYVDDCFVLAASYATSYSYATATAPPVQNHTFMLQIGLRTHRDNGGFRSARLDCSIRNLSLEDCEFAACSGGRFERLTAIGT